MAVDFIVRSESVPASTVGTAQSARLNKRAEIVTMPWEQSLGVEGRLFVANRGTITTPIVLTSATITDLRPDIVVRVPSGTLIIPLKIEVYLETTGAGNHEIMARGCANDVGNGTSTNVVPTNMHPNSGRGTACVVQRDYTADCSAPTTPFEFYRDGYPTDPDVAGNPTTMFLWSYLRHGGAPTLRGPASLMFHIGGTVAGSLYFASIVWAEFLTTDLV